MFRWALLVLLTLLCCAAVYGQPRGFIITGKLSATPQEAQEGYFHVGEEFMLITKPGSPIHDDLKTMADTDVVVVVETKAR